jgi:hypothetical protein
MLAIEKDLASCIEGELTPICHISECTHLNVIESHYHLNEFEKRDALKSIIGSIAIRDMI